MVAGTTKDPEFHRQVCPTKPFRFSYLLIAQRGGDATTFAPERHDLRMQILAVA